MLISSQVSQVLNDVAAAIAVATGQSTSTVLAASIIYGGFGYKRGDLVSALNGILLQARRVVNGSITVVDVLCTGLAGRLPQNPVPQLSTNGQGSGALFAFQWTVASLANPDRPGDLQGASPFLLAPVYNAMSTAASVLSVEAARIEGLIDDASPMGGVPGGRSGDWLVTRFLEQKSLVLQLSYLKAAQGYVGRMLQNIRNAPG